MHTQNHDISRTIKLAGSWPLAIRRENTKLDCQLVIHTALQNKPPNRQTLFIACVFALEIYFLIKKKSSYSIHLTNVNPLTDNSDILCRWLLHFINVQQTMRKNQKEKNYFSHGTSWPFLFEKKKKYSQGMQGNFYTINLGGCFACGGASLEITSREVFPRNIAPCSPSGTTPVLQCQAKGTWAWFCLAVHD